MDLHDLVERLRAGNARAVARALSMVENQDPHTRQLIREVYSDERSARIVGLTGPPGVGKSTLSDVMVRLARQNGKNVAVLAIDPTSPFSGGAILGDRARMDSASADPEIFIRSVATRGHVGGLAATTFEALVVLEAAGKDFILVETVGAGQDEVEVVAAVDVTVVVVAPGLGDDLQASKAGLLEIADVLVVNKADRDGADVVADELRAHAEGRPVLQTVARSGEGVDSLMAEIERIEGGRRVVDAWLWNVVEQIVRERIPADAWAAAIASLKDRSVTPYDAAEALLKELKS